MQFTLSQRGGHDRETGYERKEKYGGTAPKATGLQSPSQLRPADSARLAPAAPARPGSVRAKVAPLCVALCGPVDYTAHGLLQARILEGVAYPFSRGSSQPRGGIQVSRVVGGLVTEHEVSHKGSLGTWSSDHRL